MSGVKEHRMTHGGNFDVIIIGGSYAGLSAAMSLGRSMRHVLIIDSGLPCNRQTPHSHNFITQDGEEPGAIAAKARAQVSKYGTVNFLHGVVTDAKKSGRDFEVATQAGQRFSGAKLIIATGIKDEIPPIEGFKECWGISVVHCPYCHGYELRNRKTGIMANGERAFHLASLVNNLTDRITLFTSGKPDFTPEQMARLNRRKIEIITTGISAIGHRNGKVETIILENRDKLEVEAVYAVLPFTQHSGVAVSLGCELTEHGYIKVDGAQKTTVEGVFACGDNSAMMRSVSGAVHSGNLAGVVANRELAEERF